MKTFVIDASIAIKWVVEEEGTPQALVLRKRGRLKAPDLLVAECANILWKKVQRGELAVEEADLAAQLLERSDIELVPMRGMLQMAMRIAIASFHMWTAPSSQGYLGSALIRSLASICPAFCRART